MGLRTDLHNRLCLLLASLGSNYWGVTQPLPGKTLAETVLIEASKHVYYQPPENIKMLYPCILYEKDRHDVRHADDNRYIDWPKYTATVIDRNPEGRIPDKLLTLQYCSFDRRFINDNLYHDVFTIYY